MSNTRDSSADLSTKLDRLDTAIDQVTARMVQVRDGEELALRIARALPERSSRFSWLIPQFAAIAAVAIAAGVWMLRDTSTPSLSPLPSSDVVAVIAVPNTVAAVEPGTALRTKPLETASARHISGGLRRDRRLEPLEPVMGGADHERSLAPIAPMPALVVSDVAPGELAPTPELLLAPLVIADLPLTAESFPPQ
jgi:hypothetical protein